MSHIRIPFDPYVFKAFKVDHRIAYEKDVGLPVKKGPHSGELLLTNRNPEVQIKGLSVDHHISGIAVINMGRPTEVVEEFVRRIAL